MIADCDIPQVMGKPEFGNPRVLSPHTSRFGLETILIQLGLKGFKRTSKAFYRARTFQ